MKKSQLLKQSTRRKAGQLFSPTVQFAHVRARRAYRVIDKRSGMCGRVPASRWLNYNIGSEK